MKDWAEECAERWLLANRDTTLSWQKTIEGAIREALDKASAVAAEEVDDIDAEHVRSAIRALGAKHG